METWPLTLQQKMGSDSFSYTPGDTVLKSDVDAGPSKLRSRYTDGVDQYSCTIQIDIDLVNTFKTFYKTTLGNGTRTFGFLDPFSNSTEEFRFESPPEITPLGNGGRVFQLSMKWIKLP